MAMTTAMPQTRGISIIIDQDQEQVVYNKPLQQIKLAEQEQLAAIKINEKTAENQKEQHADEQQQPNEIYSQQMSTLLMNTKRAQITTMPAIQVERQQDEEAIAAAGAAAAVPAEAQLLNTFNTAATTNTTTAATLIDINGHNDGHNHEKTYNEESFNKKCGELNELINHKQLFNETGKTSTTITTTTTQLLLQIASGTIATAPLAKSLETMESPMGKQHSTAMLTISNGGLADNNINGSNTAPIPATTTTIIKCSDTKRAHAAEAAKETNMLQHGEQQEESQRYFISLGAGNAAAATPTSPTVAAIITNGEIGQFKAAHDVGIDGDNDRNDDDVGKCVRTATKSERSSLETSNEAVAKELVSITTKATQAAFSASATTTVNGKHLTDTTHVVTIKIEPKQASAANIKHNNNNNQNNRQVTVVKLNDSENTPEKISASEQSAKLEYIKNFINSNVQLNQNDKMVQKTITATANSAQQHGQQQNGNNNNTSVTDLNMSNHSPYHSLYYMMSSGQFSPCETLDSGTGSDLESNGNAASSPTITHTNGKNVAKLEMHLKTTKIRVNGVSNGTNGLGSKSANHERNGQLTAKLAEQMRACSLTDSEDGETSSSLSCDSLHSTIDFTRPSSVSPTHTATINNNNNNNINANGNIKSNAPQANTNKSLGAFLPDSLLRDIRDRKYASSDFLEPQSQRQSLESVSEHDYVQVAHAKPYFNDSNEDEPVSVHDKRSSLPNKTFILNHEDGTFIDTKLNSMPRKYEADQYYNFHVNEHENFRSFGNILHEHNDSLHDVDDDDGHDSLGDYRHHHSYERQTRSLRDDDFAGYKDIRSVSNTSTIRSSKGTVRGVKNRVRNGIATFLQLQQPNVKNYKEKDIGKVVLYTTSMGIIRDTYAKCSNVKQILRTLLIKFEERDVFMSVEYQQEIKERMNSNVIRVPQLFVEGQHIGDADTVERLNESGELRQLLKPYKSIATAYTCQTCGGYRLLPCPSCNGSKKSVHRNHFTAEFVALKCMNCDEVGLVKCHNC